MKNLERLAFGEALNSLGAHGSVGHSDCHNYGSVKGCDGGCPQLIRGGCDNPHDVIFGEYKGNPIIDDLDDYLYLLKKYDFYKPSVIEGDAINSLKEIKDNSVQLILTDHPYGTTKNKWDTVLDLKILWPEYWRILKKGGCIALWSQQPYTTDLINSQREYFRYEWIIEKTSATGHLNSNKMPMKAHENVLIFYKSLPIYNPQKTIGHKRKVSTADHKRNSKETTNWGKHNKTSYDSTERFPRDVLSFKWDKQLSRINPTQKPVSANEYFIKTYTNEGDVVLDNCAGSGSTGEAALLNNRISILIDNDKNMIKSMQQRFENINP